MEGDRTEEADKVALRIAKILSEKAFSFTPNEYTSIHRKLFIDIYNHAGKIRDYNITKKEWVLDGATVLYGSASELRATLDYDFSEGNTRTTEYLELFLRNLLLDEKNTLHNRTMHISGTFSVVSKADIETEKADIEAGKANIETEKADIQAMIPNIQAVANSRTISHIAELYRVCGKEKIFGRMVVEEVTGLKATRASELIKLLLENRAIEAVQGHGKGKYHFK